LPDFEGPLDLLLHLIKNHELDLLNLPIATITRQYLLYLDYMREMNLDLASEYLVMAATLTYLKSQIILPQDNEGEATGHDPRSQLIRRLIELNCYKELAKHLTERPRLFRDVFPARNTGAHEIEASIDPEVALSNPFQLSESFLALLERRRTLVHNVVTDQIPIASCIAKIVDNLKEKTTVSFQQLLPRLARPQEVISMFLGCLEISKMELTEIKQSEIFGPIELERRVDAQDLDRAHSLIRGLSWE
jgi:segregation and condensation protein A